MTRPVYKPCPICGGTSMAQLTDHSCEHCAEFYKFCMLCAHRQEPAGG